MITWRLEDSEHSAPLVRLTGEYAGPEPLARDTTMESSGPPLVAFAARHIPEKHALDIPLAIEAARREIPDLRCAILGEGPQTEAVRHEVQRLDLEDVIDVPGRVSSEQVASTIARASCLLHPSEREGYGLVVVEAMARGTPAIVVEGAENAATELLDPAINGFVAGSRDPDELARWIVAAVREGESLRLSTVDWYERHREALSIASSLELIAASYDQ
jgi:glycosyltransferase involved in cell wall biosynthesis